LIEGISSHAIFMLDAKGRIKSWPASAVSLYGYEESELTGEPLSVLFADPAGQRPALDNLLQEARTTSQDTEHWNERADGTVFWTTFTISPIDNDEFHGYAVISQDTTAKKQYEQILERQNDRLKEFTDILTHDLQSPLTLIDSRLELFRETGEPEHIDQIEATTERMERLVEDLLRVARQWADVPDPEPVDLQTVVWTAWEGSAAGADRASLEYEEVPSIVADHDRLCELIENLFRNAVDHSEGSVTVRVSPLETGIYIEDEGPGIYQSELDEIFEHGYTTTDSGTGYGLSVVGTIVNAHGWDIQAKAGDSGGFRFEVTGIEFLDQTMAGRPQRMVPINGSGGPVRRPQSPNDVGRNRRESGSQVSSPPGLSSVRQAERSQPISEAMGVLRYRPDRCRQANFQKPTPRHSTCWECEGSVG
jgi:PAS domain S-box-containing protein